MAKRKRRRSGCLIGVGVVVLLLLLWVGAKTMGFIKTEKGLRVEMGKADKRTVYARVSESGTIQPVVVVPVAADVSGEIVKIKVKEGMDVKKGQLLLTIRPDNYKAALEQSEASLQQTKAGHMQAKAAASQAKANVLQDSVTLTRTEGLFRESVVSRVDVENARLKYNISKAQYDASKYSVQAAYYQMQSAEASIKQARQNLDRTNIYASMNGTITQLNVELGQRVVGTMQMAGTELLKIADLSEMEVIVEISENDIVNLTLGDSSKIEVDAFTQKEFHGKVTDIAYSAKSDLMSSTDQVTNFEVKVEIAMASYKELMKGDRSPFRPGMTALVEIFTDKAENTVCVPIQAVTLSKKKLEDEAAKPAEVVYVIEGNLAKEVTVKTGISDDTYIQVLEGLESDREIITGPYTTLSKEIKEDTEVRVMKEGEEDGKRKWEK